MSCTPFCTPPAAARQQFSRRRRRHAPARRSVRTPRRRRRQKAPALPGRKSPVPGLGPISPPASRPQEWRNVRVCPRRGEGVILRIKQKAPTLSRCFFFGAADEARTRYLHLGKVALYQMSYSRIFNLQVAFLFYPCRGHVALTRFDDSKVSCLPLRRYHSGRNRFRRGFRFLDRKGRFFKCVSYDTHLKNGASGRNRTTDTGIFSPLLYRLSYRGICRFAKRLFSIVEFRGIVKRFFKKVFVKFYRHFECRARARRDMPFIRAKPSGEKRPAACVGRVPHGMMGETKAHGGRNFICVF